MPVSTAPSGTGIASAPADAAGKKLTDEQIATWAKQAGFTGDDVAIAVAVALAESGGQYARVSAPNSDGTRDYGVWQINSVHAQLFQQYPQWWSVSNANMAKAVHAQQGWGVPGKPGRGWTTYSTGAYLLFLPRGKAAAASAPDGGVIEANTEHSRTTEVTDFANVFRAGFQPLVAASQWIGDANNWVRVAQVVLGAALVVAGITIVARPVTSAVAGPIASVVSKGKV